MAIRRRLAALARQWPLGLLLAALGVAMWLAETHHWRRGAFAIGSTMLLAAAMRAVLPEPTVRMLSVRGRWLDVAMLSVVGVAICALSMLVPGYR